MNPFLTLFRTAVLLVLAAPAVEAQSSPGRIVDVTLLPGGKVRVPVETALSDPDTLLLESADSPAGPWAKEYDFQRNVMPGGREFLLPVKPGVSQRFYRARQLDPDRKPWIRFVSPRDFIRPGRIMTMLGARFSSTPGENVIKFERGPQSWTVNATESAADFVLFTVPAELPAVPGPNDSKGVPYRVTVTNAAGTSNGVGCYVSATATHSLKFRPSDDAVLLFTAPGTLTDKLLVGGGIPPYRLVPQTPADAAKILAQMNGPVVTVTGFPGPASASVNITVEDSTTPTPRTATQAVVLRDPFFKPPFNASFRTLLAGTAPGLTLTSQFGGMQPEQMEVRFQNLQIDLTTLSPGATLGLIRLYDTRTTYDRQELQVTEASAERAKFVILSYAGGDVTKIAAGEFIANPPSLAVTTLNSQAGSFMPTTIDQDIQFADGVFRLPAAPGQTVTLTAMFTSVSAHQTHYHPQRFTAADKTFLTVGITAGAPRLERLLPTQGEIQRFVRLRGTGFGATPAQNTVTFAGRDGTRVPAVISGSSPGELIVSVPRGAITGPVRVEAGGKVSNDFLFAVRFSPSMLLAFPSFAGNTPVAPQFIHQQPVDEGETLGEVPPGKFTATLDRGRLSLTGLTVGQVVGTSRYRNNYTGQSGTVDIRYQGTETAPPNRQWFDIGISNIIFANLFVKDAPGGDGVILEMENSKTSIRLNTGIVWDHQFTAPIYRPPPAATAVALRLEAQSDPWGPFAGSEMRVIENFNLNTSP